MRRREKICCFIERAPNGGCCRALTGAALGLQPTNSIRKEIYDYLILPRESKYFLKSIKDVLKIDLHLAQNRFYFEKTDVNDKQRNKNKQRNKDGNMYGPLLVERVRHWREEPGGVIYQGVRERECSDGEMAGLLKH